MNKDESTSIARTKETDDAALINSVPGCRVARNFTQEQLRLVDLISSRFCNEFAQTLARHRPTRVVARLLGAEILPFWEVLNCLQFGHSTALARCEQNGRFCLIEIDRGLLQPLCGEETRTYELCAASAAIETRPEGFYPASMAETGATGFWIAPPRVVYALKNGDRRIEVAAVAIEPVIPVGVYNILLKAWRCAWADIQFEFEILGYDHDLCVLEQFMSPLAPMMVFGIEIQIRRFLGIINVSVPSEIVNFRKDAGQKRRLER